MQTILTYARNLDDLGDFSLNVRFLLCYRPFPALQTSDSQPFWMAHHPLLIVYMANAITLYFHSIPLNPGDSAAEAPVALQPVAINGHPELWNGSIRALLHGNEISATSANDF